MIDSWLVKKGCRSGEATARSPGRYSRVPGVLVIMQQAQGQGGVVGRRVVRGDDVGRVVGGEQGDVGNGAAHGRRRPQTKFLRACAEGEAT